MGEYKSILIALGTADEHQPVMRKALAMASPDTRLQLLHVVEPFPYMDVSQGSALDVNDDALAFAGAVIGDVGKQYAVDDQCIHVELGRPAAMVNQKALDLQSDLIILGRRDRHGVKRLLGSTANAVLHHAKCDVLVIHIADGDSDQP